MLYVKNINFRLLAYNKDNFTGKFRYWSWVVLLIFGILQCLFFWSWANFMATIIIIIAWSIFLKFTLRQTLIVNFPLSTFLIFGFTFTQFYLPLVFTFLEQKPVIHNLHLPYEVFVHMIIDFAVLLISHKIYRSTFTSTRISLRAFLQKGDFYKPPNNRQIWIIGLIGIAATCYVYIFTKSATQVTGNVINKFIEALIPFSYAPFFIPLGKLYGNKKLYNYKTTIILVFFTIILFTVSIARNSRGAFMYGFTAIGFGYGLGLLLGYYRPPSLKITKVLILIVIYWFFSNPVAELGTAMVIVRAQRADISSLALIEMTLEVFEDKKAILMKRAEDLNLEQTTWNENYLNNIFLARFCNIKYNDLSLIQAHKIGNLDNDMYNFTLSRILAVFPAPIIEGLGLVKDKKSFINYSYGDFLYAKASMDFDILGANLAGHFDGTGMAAFGWFYLVFLGIGIIPVFALCDGFFIHKNIASDSKQKFCLWQGHFSLCGLLALTSIFQFLPAESVSTTATFILRVWLQMILLYFCVYRLSSFISRLFL